MNSTNTINIIKFIAATVFAFGIILATALIVKMPAYTGHTQISFSDNIFMKMENAADLMNPNDNIQLFFKNKRSKTVAKNEPLPENTNNNPNGSMPNQENITNNPNLNVDAPASAPNEYEGWFRVSIPYGFHYDAASFEFSDAEGGSNFTFSVNKYENIDLATFADLVADESQYTDEMESEGTTINIDRKELVYGGRAWTLITTLATNKDSGEAWFEKVLFISDIGQGEYVQMTIDADPNQQWIVDMLSTFSLLDGDPYENYMTYISSLPTDEDDQSSSSYDEALDYDEGYYEDEYYEDEYDSGYTPEEEFHFEEDPDYSVEDIDDEEFF